MEIFIPNDFQKTVFDTNTVFLGPDISEVMYLDNRNGSSLNIAIENKITSKPYYFLELGEDSLFYTENRYNLILDLLVLNISGNHKEIQWKSKSIKKIANKKAIYLNYNHSRGNNISVIFFTNDLSYVKIHYSNDSIKTKNELDFDKVLNSIKWE